MNKKKTFFREEKHGQNKAGDKTSAKLLPGKRYKAKSIQLNTFLIKNPRSRFPTPLLFEAFPPKLFFEAFSPLHLSTVEPIENSLWRRSKRQGAARAAHFEEKKIESKITLDNTIKSNLLIQIEFSGFLKSLVK